MTDRKLIGSLAGQLLIAMPQMRDPRFARTVIYMVAHTEDGAMGLVLNRILGSITFPDLLQQLGIGATDAAHNIHVHSAARSRPAAASCFIRPIISRAPPCAWTTACP